MSPRTKGVLVTLAIVAAMAFSSFESRLIQDHGPGWLQGLVEVNSHTPWGCPYAIIGLM